jgi:hypothetical protein
MKRTLGVLLAVLAVSTATAWPASKPDVLTGAVFRCVRDDGRVEFTNLQQRERTGVVCTPLFDYYSTMPGRGLAGWRAFYADKDLGLLIYDDRTRRTGNVVEGWVMLSYSKPQVMPHTRKIYNRAVAKMTADCDSHDLAASTIQARRTIGSGETIVGTLLPYKEEAAPGTVDDVVVIEMCKPPQKKSTSMTTRDRS